MIVTIVARTRMGSGACIGGISEDGRSVRLIAPDMAFNEHFNLDYHVGQVWEIAAEPPDDILPPHTENVVVRRKRLIGQADDLVGLIERHMPPRAGGLEALYDGLTQGKSGGPLYVAHDAPGDSTRGVPSFSTMFWRPDQPLTRDIESKRIRYRYPTDDGGRTLTFVGFQEPVDVIPAGTLLRVSLAHWWRPAEHPEGEPRCYLQLSGWFDDEMILNAKAPGRKEDSMDYSESLRPGDLALNPSPDLDEARTVLKRVYGYDDFRPLQAEIIANVLAGRDSLAVMPPAAASRCATSCPRCYSPA